MMGSPVPNFGKVALMLQPVFVELTDDTSTSSTHTSSSISSCSGGEYHQKEHLSSSSDLSNPISTLSSTLSGSSDDNLPSLWKVATKIKSVMADGIRFENLTWRAWCKRNIMANQHSSQMRDSQLMGKINQDSTSSSNGLQGGAGTRVNGSQATHPTKQITPSSTSIYGRGYSKILAEIQRASMRISQVITDSSASPADSTRSCSFPLKANPNTSHNENHHGMSIDSTASNNSSKTAYSEPDVLGDSKQREVNAIKNARRRKKHVERFIKKQQQLEKISEQMEEPKTIISIPSSHENSKVYDDDDDDDDNNSNNNNGKLKALVTESPISPVQRVARETFATANQVEVSSASTAVSFGSESDLRKPKTLPPLRKSDYMPGRPSGSPDEGKPAVSLLTMLLNQSGVHSRRPDSCPPPDLGVSPPTRPGAPVPPQVHTAYSDPLLPLNSTDNIDLSRQSKVDSGMGVDSSNTLSKLSPSQMPPNQRRRAVPNPSDFTNTMFIW